jgi:hypothetical protein
MKLAVIAGIVSAVVLWSAAAGAKSAVGVSGDVGLGGLGGKAYATLQTALELREAQLAFGLFGRVRLPLQDAAAEGYVRSRDWDEATDYVHIVRYIQYQHDFGSVRLEAEEGELLGTTLGHGTLLRDYTNIADPDHPHSGLRLRLGSRRVAVEALIDNFVRPSVIAARVDAAPVGRAPGFRIGASLVVDPRAPLQVRLDASNQREVDSAYNLQAETKPLALAGVDAEYTFGDDRRGRVTPYVDLNTSFYGLGGHLGASGRVPMGSRAQLGVQLEYRVNSGGYSPAYVETFYDLDRYQASLSFADPSRVDLAARSPKLAALRDGVYGGQGVLFQGGVDFERYVRARVGVSHRPGPDSTSLWVRASTTPIPRLDLGLLIVARGLAEAQGASGLAAMAEGRVRLADHWYALAQYSRLWSLSAEARYFGILQCFNVAIGTNWSS